MDVVESSSVVHRCLVLDVCVVVPRLVRPIGDVLITPAEALENASRDVLLEEVRAGALCCRLVCQLQSSLCCFCFSVVQPLFRPFLLRALRQCVGVTTRPAALNPVM